MELFLHRFARMLRLLVSHLFYFVENILMINYCLLTKPYIHDYAIKLLYMVIPISFWACQFLVRIVVSPFQVAACKRQELGSSRRVDQDVQKSEHFPNVMMRGLVAKYIGCCMQRFQMLELHFDQNTVMILSILQ